ncbi:MAG: SBBP repeat-containing protein, partial [Candidatus Methylomirabilales bacterium]
DAFVAKVRADGSALSFSTYLGGSDLDVGFGIAADASGNAYATGQTRSINFRTERAFQPAIGGGRSDAFVTKISELGLVVELVDPVPDLLAGPAVTTDVTKLAQGEPVVQGVAADGVARVVVRVTTPGPGTVELSLVDEAGMPLASLEEAGFLAQLGEAVGSDTIFVPTVDVPNKGPMAFAVYQAPSRFARAASAADFNEKERQVSFRVRFTPQTGAVAEGSTCPIKIARPPVVLVHGLWGFEDSWDRFDPLNTDQRFFIRKVDYSETNAAGFALNTPIVGEQITKIINDEYKIAERVAAVQADVVTHSMGGLLVRRLPVLGNGFFRDDNFEQGDVHRLITIATPHFGSPLARFLRRSPCVSRIFTERGAPTDQGAIEDLVPNSRALTQLNRPPSTLQMHVIVGRASEQQKRASDSSLGLGYIRLRCSRELRNILPGQFFDTVLQTGDHDLIVPVRSQQGDFVGGAVSDFFPLGLDVIHTRIPRLLIGRGELEAEAIAQRVIELLNAPFEPPTFGQFPAPAGRP